MNFVSLSEIMVEGTPCSHNTLSMNWVANYDAVTLLLVGITLIILLNLSMTTKTASNPLDLGNGVMRSKEMSVQGLVSMGMGWRRPYFLWLTELLR